MKIIRHELHPHIAKIVLQRLVVKDAPVKIDGIRGSALGEDCLIYWIRRAVFAGIQMNEDAVSKVSRYEIDAILDADPELKSDQVLWSMRER